MTLHQLHNTLAAFLSRIESKAGTDLHDAFVGEVIETGGTFVDLPNDATSHLFEVSLHNVVGRGASDQEAFTSWQRAAQRIVDFAPNTARAANAAAQLAGGGQCAASGTFSGQRDVGEARDLPTFQCALWPECACPGGTTRPECPGQKSCVGAQ
ncbi:hypothetical protein HKX54_02230 [Sulfitobacter sp. M57]|uniref:hypothetical protein n=1 Tax=unclassified Sulfitobacter TaxID=196795 RepID=UPI0023E291FC|nr:MULTISPECIES: hypothetical protein [unclassified Sulfitobacter]MDF3413258.1 hypothetical protein [Sulfitobacter sp. KE5]MDF3421460.1 hypothetical protein [Sulfitobacter sp. KE43]MDF3431806.1 hypothetical protein [Sulfitobacter sp. KE42]MDF3457446.1 hypothetical protein [Sulfitobacter sp. S74]MDF3461349.1 hypothetical protein [Sulfitobacter sp. Ks18]